MNTPAIAPASPANKDQICEALERLITPLPALPADPLVSVLVINYNYARFLPKALDSLLAQSYQNWEAILVDDGSSDESRDIMRSYSERDARFHCVFKQNEGVPCALNDAYAQARGQIIALLDSDDAYLPEKIARSVELFRQNPDCGLGAHLLRVIDANDAPLPTPLDEDFHGGWLASELIHNGGRGPTPAAGGLIFRAEVARQVFPIPRDFRRGCDSYLACLSLLITRYAFVPEQLALYRQHGANISSTRARRWPDVVLYERMVEDLRKTVDAEIDFIRSRTGLNASSALAVEDNWHYKIGATVVKVLSGKAPNGVNLERLLQKAPSTGLRVILCALTTLPRFIAKPFVYVWLGEYPGKWLWYPLVRLFRLRRNL